ncbi:MAG: hypothetical protein LBF77_06625 [Spirochaetaceae bacterium]|jgi:alpha-L-arabinofuranosidase|nr:hypothetical protein [Spirochaetaceae bacterium]
MRLWNGLAAAALPLCLVPVISGCGNMPGSADSGIRINLDLNKTGPEIAETFYGIFYEDINYAADGGIYPELVRNRSFESKTSNPKPMLRTLSGWVFNYEKLGEGEAKGSAASPLSASNPTYSAITVTRAPYVIINRGYAAVPDMALTQGWEYNFYFYVRNKNYAGNILVSLQDENGRLLTNQLTVSPDSSAWKKYGPYTLVSQVDAVGMLVLRCEGTGAFDLDFVSLMPADTWGYGQSTWPYGGLRRDLVEALAALKPGFIRFPGGCIVEGAYRHETTYNWKDTIGSPETRRENSNLWGYMMSYGMGFHEYFQLCEDLGAEPVPVLSAGILCQARNDGTNTEADYKPGTKEFDALIQDYLDLIEYASGGADSVWGAKRAANGHSAPFNLKKIGIGNENWGPAYWRNFKAIRAAVLAIYPGIDVITTSGPHAAGGIFDEAWTQINANYKDAIVDEHYYVEPDWFLANTRRYDMYRRNGVRIFVGEYAAHEKNRGNTWYTALCEAAYITGLERNADIVKMASYAPLFARDGMYQWAPDMIWFDGEGITNLTPNYQIQKLFSNNTGTLTLPSEKDPGVRELFHASSLDTKAGFIYTKLVNPYPKEQRVTLNYGGRASTEREAVITTASGKQTAKKAASEESVVFLNGNSLALKIMPYSVVVIRIPSSEKD